MSKQADLYRDIAALTGLTYAYCDYLRGELRKRKILTLFSGKSKSLSKKS